MRNLQVEDLAQRMKPFFEKAGYAADLDTLVKIAPIVQERLVTLDEAPELAGFFFKAEIVPAAEELVPAGMTREQALDVARQSLAVLKAAPELTPEAAEPPMRELVEKLGLKAGQVFGLLRVAVTGQKVSPPLFESMMIMGRERVLKQVEQAVRMLEG